MDSAGGRLSDGSKRAPLEPPSFAVNCDRGRADGAQTDEMIARHKADMQAASAHGVSGVLTYVVQDQGQDELFWEQDRRDFLDRTLARLSG